MTPPSPAIPAVTGTVPVTGTAAGTGAVTGGWPGVGVVVPTRGDRPAGLAAAVAGVLAQDYPGEVTVTVVYDAPAPGPLPAGTGAGGRVRVLANNRTRGLAGARNTGILAAGGELVAFCDDDDTWQPGKLTAQVTALLADPAAELASCAITVCYQGASHPRLAGTTRVTREDLLRSRMVMVHSSTYLIRRTALQGDLGLLDEQIPGSQNEDWDLALRAAARHPVIHVDQPLVTVAWGTTSHYARQWQSRAAGLEWMLARHPAITATPRGAARVYGQLAFAAACQHHTAATLTWAARALRARWREPRALLALAVAARLTTGDRVQHHLHARGHGI